MEIGTVVTFANVTPDLLWMVTDNGVMFVSTRTGLSRQSSHTVESLQRDIDNGFLRVLD